MSDIREQWYEDGTATRYWLGDNELHVNFEMLGDDGEVEISGSVKWDGCMNWETSPSCMYHYCSPQDVTVLADRLKEVWVLGSQIMPKADSSMYGK